LGSPRLNVHVRGFELGVGTAPAGSRGRWARPERYYDAGKIQKPASLAIMQARSMEGSDPTVIDQAH
jgi:hypothetical protein